MATYKEIKGVTVQSLDVDPVQNVGTWASGGDVNTARSFGGGAGTTDANLYYGGSAAPTYYDQTELYNGTSWTEVNDLNTGRGSAAGMGTSTAAVCAGGRVSPPSDTAVSETWDGTSWSEGNDLNSERYSIANRGAGTATAGLCAGGRNRGPASYDALVEEYNGTSWTEVNDMPTGVESASGIGTQTAAGVWGGYTGSYRASGFLYDGTNWTATTDFPVASGSASESGTTTDGLLFGYYNSPGSAYVANTAAWDGSAWTEVNDLSTARGGGGGPKAALNTSKNGIMVSGTTTPGSASAATEEWTFPPVTAAVLTEGDVFLSGGITLKGFGKAAGIPAATWSSGGSLNTARFNMGTSGSQTAALAIAGKTSTEVNNVESYDGSSWSETTEVNQLRRSLGYLQSSGRSSADIRRQH